jgi:hypothetical protein
MHAHSVTVSVTAHRFYHAFVFGEKRFCDAAKYVLPDDVPDACAGRVRRALASTMTGSPLAWRKPLSSQGERRLPWVADYAERVVCAVRAPGP